MKQTPYKFFYVTLLFLFYSNSLLSDPSISEILRDRKSTTPDKQQLLLKQLPTSWQTLEPEKQRDALSLLTKGTKKKKAPLSETEGTILQRAMLLASPLVARKVTAVLAHSKPKDWGYRKGHIYELACYLYLTSKGIKITNINTVYTREYGEVDLESDDTVFECKNTHGWGRIKETKRKLAKLKKFAQSREVVLYSQTPIPDHMKTWLDKQDIDYYELSIENIIQGDGEED